ncbi:N-formylglutamate amidohydrolase [Novosphingobium sp. Leaf2]|nr:N-formylglutamate amidohydrolase [Novosphingobium sp. Leaf2]
MLEAGAPSALPILIAVPHGGRSYSAALLADLRHGASAAVRLEDRHADTLARGVAAATGADLLIAHAPRALVDLNRSPDDVDWEMFTRDARPASGVPPPGGRVRSGLGLIPRRLVGTGELWRRRFGRADLEFRLRNVHEPYHAALNAALKALHARWGAALLIDLHSMPPLSGRPGGPGAHVVVGDRFGASSNGTLVAAAFAHFAQVAREAAHNRPYAGGYVLERHGNPQAGFNALQIEIDRSCYLDAQLMEPGAGMARMVEDLAGLVRRLAPIVADLGGEANARVWPQAAE